MTHRKGNTSHPAKARHQNDLKVGDIEQPALEGAQPGNRDALYEAKPKREPVDAANQPPRTDEGGTWQIKVLLGIIAAGVLMLVLKSIGLF